MSILRVRLAVLRETVRSGRGMRGRMAADGGLSRREVLGLGGAALLGSSALARAGGGLADGRFRLEYDGRVATGYLGPHPVWQIDPTHYGGQPRLRVEQDAARIDLALTGACHPGTELPADFTARLERHSGEWSVRLEQALGGAAAEGPLVPWLQGQPLLAPVRLDQRACALGVRHALHLRGTGTAAMHADGRLALRGRGLAELRGPQAAAIADSVELGPAEDSLLDPTPARRCRLALRRGEREWRLAPRLAGAGWQVDGPPEALDTLTIEAGLTERGAPVHLLLAEGQGPSGLAFIAPSLVAEGGTPLRLTLAHPRLAWVFDGWEEGTTLVAALADETRALTVDGCRVLVGGGPDAELFEVERQGRQVVRLRCEPLLLTAVAPLGEALLDVPPRPAGERLALVDTVVDTDHTAPNQLRLAADTKPPLIRRPPVVNPPTTNRPNPQPQPPNQRPPLERPKPENPPQLFVRADRVEVIRPDDFLRLGFEFANLRLESGNRGQVLAPIDATKPSYVVVHLQSQHLQEQAFAETDSGADPVPGPVPVAARMAGGSRLAFQIPAGQLPLRYDLATLLDWSHWVPSLVPVARPPAPQHGLLHLGDGSVVLKRPGGAAVRLDPGSIRAATQPTSQTATVLQAAPLAADAERARRPRPGSRLGKVGAGRPLLEAQENLAAPWLVGRIGLQVTPVIGPPDGSQTAIELPYRLMLSPHAGNGWAHAAQPVTHGQRTELWHTRLGVATSTGVSEAPSYLRAVRAVWSPDYQHWKPETGGLVPITGEQRHQLVRLTSDFSLSAKGFTPLPVDVDQLMLSALGGWLKCQGVWQNPDPPASEGLTVSRWIHQAMMGRDQYVQLDQLGYLLPFGHKAVLITVTERKYYHPRVDGPPIAFLRQRQFIVVREPEKLYPLPGMAHQGRELPFRRVRLVTRQTPNLDLPTPDQCYFPATRSGFWAQVGGRDFAFHCLGEDWDGEQIEFTAPMVWVRQDDAVKPTAMGGVIGPAVGTVAPSGSPGQPATLRPYNAPENHGRRTLVLQGQPVAFAESGKPGDTVLETQTITLGVGLVPAPAAEAIAFYPAMVATQVQQPALKNAAGPGSGGDGLMLLRFPQRYLDSGWQNNAAALFLQLADPSAPMGVTFPGDKGGGVARPTLNVTGLSRTLGPTGGDPAQLVDGTFDPLAYFGQGCKLLGGIDLFALLIPDGGQKLKEHKPLQGSVGDGTQLPKLVYEYVYPTPGAPATAVNTRLDWAPQVHDWPSSSGPVFQTRAGTSFQLNSTTSTPLDGKAPTWSVTGRLENFQINLIKGVIDVAEVRFRRFEFTSGTGQSMRIDPQLDDIRFVGPLSLFDKLFSLLGPMLQGSGSGGHAALPGEATHFALDTDPDEPHAVRLVAEGGDLNSFSLEPILNIDASHIEAGVSVGLPAIAIGVFSLRNIHVRAAVTVPFTGDPVSLAVDFCDQHAPFLLSVGIIGGGGFFHIGLTTNGVESIEGSLEAGGAVALNLGVAAGAVEIMFGLHLTYASDAIALGAYLRIHGCLSVLGLINVSLTFLLELTYREGPALFGRAELTVEIDILFFSTSVSVAVERQFAGETAQHAALPQPDPGMRYADASGGPLRPLPRRPLTQPPPAPPPKIEQLLSADDWTAYCSKFA